MPTQGQMLSTADLQRRAEVLSVQARDLVKLSQQICRESDVVIRESEAALKSLRATRTGLAR